MSPDPPFTDTTERLVATLACLDLELEAELALYRRHQTQTVGGLPPYVEAEPELDLESLTSAPKNDVLADVSVETASFSPEPMDANSTLVPALTDTEAVHLETMTESNMPVDTDASLRENATESDLPGELVPFAALEDEEPETLPEPYGADITAEPEAFERFLDPSIGDYLESSEALLKHLEASSEATEQKVQQLTRKSWMTALKVIMGLLGLGVAITVCAVLVNQWGLSKSRQPGSVPQGSFSPSPRSTQPKATGGGMPSAAIIPSPQESIAVGTASPTPLATEPSTSQSSPVSPLTPTPKSTSASGSGQYLVVAPYQGDASLQQARQLVPDAFITTIEGQEQIQLGQLDDLQQAQRMASDLKKEGFSASVANQN